MSFQGDRVRITTCGNTVEGLVVLGSDNRKSLMLGFPATLDGCMGIMPVLRHDDGVYRNLITNHEVGVEWLPTLKE